ncbi:MAG TPA: sigma-70 family RNA polymerase sigma factor [Acidimicrobiales bacterium]|nr:sigma-70 family RNA polymerase sigma factor [Acidimicrobiales bacterium]
MVDLPDPERPREEDEHVDEELVALCRRLHPRLVAALALHHGSTEVGEDLTQETLVRVWERWDEVRHAQSPEAWAFRVAFNLSTSAWRRRSLERRTAPVVDVRQPGEHDATDAVAVRQALGTLTRRQRAAVILRYFADLTVQETADAMGCAPGTVRALTSQALDRLRAHLHVDLAAEDDDDDEGVSLHE